MGTDTINVGELSLLFQQSAKMIAPLVRDNDGSELLAMLKSQTIKQRRAVLNFIWEFYNADIQKRVVELLITNL